MGRKWSCAFVVLLLLSWTLAGLAQAEETAIALDEKYAQDDHFIIIDKSDNKLHYFQKGKPIKTFSVATGLKNSYTPEGLFSIREKIKNRPYYKEKIKGGDPRNPLGDRWLGLKVVKNGKVSYAYGIHGTNNEKSIGKYVSQGCIRMYNKEVRWLYDQVTVGTRVLIRP